jgi:hypothetical protein
VEVVEPAARVALNSVHVSMVTLGGPHRHTTSLTVP